MTTADVLARVLLTLIALIFAPLIITVVGVCILAGFLRGIWCDSLKKPVKRSGA